jgi:HSP20 family protein
MANIVRRQQSPSNVATRTPTQPFDPLRLFRDLLRWDPFAQMMPAELERPLGNFVPNFEIRETDDAYIFKADLPGVADADLEISLSGNRLTVSGKRESESRDESERYYAYERAYGTFTRSFTLPEEIDANNVGASLDNGVLTVHVPKPPESQPKKITLGEAKGSGQTQPASSQQKPKA